MKTIHFFGECMLELKPVSDGMLAKSFAGDVFNSAVYLKRCFPAIETSVITAVGADSISDEMLAAFRAERLSQEFVFRHPHKTIGVYLIETDAHGERSFVYWRENSAARDTMHFISTDIEQKLQDADAFFFSGIPLATMRTTHRDTFWRFLNALKTRGTTIVFDPNYRATLWESKSLAISEYEKALRLADIAMPGVEDFETLYDVRSAQDVMELCRRFSVNEIVVKNGPASVVTCVDNAVTEHRIEPADNVVDTTSAGDAFNGIYLGKRLSGHTVDDAVKDAARAAATVIGFAGAIAPKRAFLSALNLQR